MTTETRYFRNSGSTVNGLYGRDLGIAQTALDNYKTDFDSGPLTIYWGIRVWKRSEAGTEFEITDGTPVAVVSRSVDGSGYQSATWACPLTTMFSAYNIVVRIYIKFGTGAWHEPRLCTEYPLKYPWHTEQLGATSLDAATWTVTYWTRRTYDPDENIPYGDFMFGVSTYNSRIENFSWTPVGVGIASKRLLVGVGI